MRELNLDLARGRSLALIGLPPGVIPVLLVPVLQSRPDSEGGADAAVHLPGQRVPARAEEPLADPLPHRRGFSVVTPDPDAAASGEAV